MSARGATAAGNHPANKKRSGPWQGAGPAFRCSPDSYTTIPVSNGCRPDKMLAPNTIVLENGQADPGTGQTPAGETGRNQLSRSRNWTKFRTDLQESSQPEWPRDRLRSGVQPENKDATAGDFETLCI